jgi:hypothetical protein
VSKSSPQSFLNIFRASGHSRFSNHSGGAVRGGVIKHLHEAGTRDPLAVPACQGARIKGRSAASMLDAIIPALKHRIPSELRS